MAQQITYTCDRCGKPGAIHLELEVAVTPLKSGPEGQDEDVEIRLLDLCLDDAARALKLSTDGMGYVVKKAWIDSVLRKDG